MTKNGKRSQMMGQGFERLWKSNKEKRKKRFVAIKGVKNHSVEWT